MQSKPPPPKQIVNLHECDVTVKESMNESNPLPCPQSSRRPGHSLRRETFFSLRSPLIDEGATHIP